MKKRLILLSILLFSLFTMLSCKSKSQTDKDPFEIYNNTGSYHIVFEYKIIYNNKDYYQNGERWYDKDNKIDYSVSDGVEGKYKQYYSTTHMYTYNYSKNIWEREPIGEGIDNSGFKGWKDKNNYDFYNEKTTNCPYGYYKLKSHIDIGQSDYYKVYLNSKDQLEIVEKTIFSDRVYISTRTYVETNVQNMNLKLPTSYVDK